MEFKIIIILILSAIVKINTIFSQVGIGTTSPVSSAELDITSTTKGFLVPRMTHAQKTAIISPVAGLQVWCTDCGSTGQMQVYNGITWTNLVGGTASVSAYSSGSTFCTSGAAAVVNVTSLTGRIWMDRNLGAAQVATSSIDANAYGDLYQWGRRTDGHQCRTSPNTSTLSSTDQPAHGDFILSLITPYDWRSPQNTNLWNGLNGVNNPCPTGYRLPTDTELSAELSSWTGGYNATGAFASPLKLTMAGYHNNSDGSLQYVGTHGLYWSSTISGTTSLFLFFYNSTAVMGTDGHSRGYSVRCIKD